MAIVKTPSGELTAVPLDTLVATVDSIDERFESLRADMLTPEEVAIIRKAIANLKKKKAAKKGTTDSVEPGVLIDAMTRAFNMRLDAAEARILELEEKNTVLASEVARLEFILAKIKFTTDEEVKSGVTY